MEQIFIENENANIINQGRNDLPKPDYEVCGADYNKIDYWNFISNSFTDFEFRQKASVGLIKKRYFGLIIPDFAKIRLPASYLDQEICTTTPKCEECPLRYNCEYYKDNSFVNASVTFADFFCGAGGLSLGFEWSGLYPTLANDIDPWFIATYHYNRPNYSTEISACDIQSWLEVNEHRTDWNIDIVSGGVPCQSFSNANRQRKDADPRDKLYSSLMKAAGLIKPKAILIENVSGMIKEFEGVQSDLSNLGYDSDHIIINSKDYGIPQNRRRLFFIAFSKDYYVDSSSRVHKTIESIKNSKSDQNITLREAITDLPTLAAHSKRNDTKFNNPISGTSFFYHNLTNASPYVARVNGYKNNTTVFNHKARYNNNRDIEIFRILKQGENSLAKSIEHIMPYGDRNAIFKDKYYKLQYDTYCKTITAHMRYDCNMYIHPEQSRGLTTREAARVQSFPDDYVFLGNFQRLYQQVGNAVPPLLAAMLGNAIKENI